MAFSPKVRRHARRRIQFQFVTLAVIEGQGVAGVPVTARQGQTRGGIEPAAEQANRFLGDWHERVLYNYIGPVRIRFLTSTPLDIRQGSGTYVGIDVLARTLRELGHTVDFETPRVLLPVYTL